MKISEITDNWDKDSIINEPELLDQTLKTQSLHAKYIRSLSNARTLLIKAEREYIELRAIKDRYYRGEMTAEELQVHEWKQFQKKILKGEIDKHIASDASILDLTDRIAYLNVIISTLESIMKSIGSRSFDIKNFIEYKKYTQGDY